jgi:hypothetical protein
MLAHKGFCKDSDVILQQLITLTEDEETKCDHSDVHHAHQVQPEAERARARDE